MLGIDTGWLVAALLLSVRLGAMALMAPPFGGSMLPASVRVAVVLCWAAVLARPNTTGPLPLTTGTLVAAIATEVALGSTLALGLSLAFAVFATGARLLDVQIGFGMGQVFDPFTRSQLPILSAVFGQVSLIGFFLVDGHHALMRGLALSVESVPPGAAWAIGPFLPAIGRGAGQMLSLGFAMVAPVVFCLTLLEVGLGVLSRNLPQMNTLVVGIPIKVAVGLAALAAWAGFAGPVMQRSYATAFAIWSVLWQ